MKNSAVVQFQAIGYLVGNFVHTSEGHGLFHTEDGTQIPAWLNPRVLKAYIEQGQPVCKWTVYPKSSKQGGLQVQLVRIVTTCRLKSDEFCIRGVMINKTSNGGLIRIYRNQGSPKYPDKVPDFFHVHLKGKDFENIVPGTALQVIARRKSKVLVAKKIEQIDLLYPELVKASIERTLSAQKTRQNLNLEEASQPKPTQRKTVQIIKEGGKVRIRSIPSEELEVALV